MSVLNSIQNIFRIEELKKRLYFTFALLTVYRIGAHVPTPGIDGEQLSKFLTDKGGALMGFFDMFSGGALSRVTIFALGIMPYISASIIFQLLTVVIPAIGKLAKEGEEGRKKITQYTRYGTIVISLIQSFGIAVGLETMANGQFIHNPGWGFRLVTMITLTAGTTFIMWLGEQITERGLGNGISLIIFAGIVARLPEAVINTGRLIKAGELSIIVMIIIFIMMVGIIAGIIYMERGQRKIPVQYAKRVVGRKMYGGQSTHLPLKINTSGVIPPIFASSIIMFPATIAGFIAIPWVQSFAKQLAPGSLVHDLLYVAMIVFFCYFYTAIVFNPVDIADNLKKYGGYIPGIRPGKNTSDYIFRVLSRLTFVGAIYLSVVCVLPSMLISKFNVPFYFGGTSLLIVVGVALDTVSQIESHLLTRSYDGLLKKGRIKGRR
ncbi:preprotein translocase subunit SecY [Candidatus Magnetominusculus xianensis]|uniref:Protein translocase subunit SecY n=1 Tax=Candidatus Magnetominusculus xianensis TaxID=1748249 RepID=A0ABR5SDM3_9BACT|nr:preprotein translocase subunit SecY [Candidatus Magnetominusculus xianensis]KWT83414.1 preprotein translocase subunit SecY [Candidatus Magnetominusculus xianensis]MBF0403524.1 preprotein translocase subunit SecY [Nitrospirota bacterium]